MAHTNLPPIGTQIRVVPLRDAPQRLRHRHTNEPVTLWTITGYEGDVMHLEGQAIDCEYNTVMNALTRYRKVIWSITLTDSDREALAKIAARG